VAGVTRSAYSGRPFSRRLRRQNARLPAQAMPTAPITHVSGSGTSVTKVPAAWGVSNDQKLAD